MKVFNETERARVNVMLSESLGSAAKGGFSVGVKKLVVLGEMAKQDESDKVEKFVNIFRDECLKIMVNSTKFPQ